MLVMLNNEMAVFIPILIISWQIIPIKVATEVLVDSFAKLKDDRGMI